MKKAPPARYVVVAAPPDTETLAAWVRVVTNRPAEEGVRAWHRFRTALFFIDPLHRTAEWWRNLFLTAVPYVRLIVIRADSWAGALAPSEGEWLKRMW